MRIFSDLDPSKGAVCVLSGGMDSTIATAIASRYFDKLRAISFYYKQKLVVELDLAVLTTKNLGIPHHDLDIGFLGDISQQVSSNIIGSSIEVPSIKEVLGSPQPVTYVPNRNSILLNIAAAYAESNGLGYVITGLQSHDTYGYYDATPTFVEKMNSLWSLNRKSAIGLVAPFIKMSKAHEINELVEAFGRESAIEILKNTITCYNPSYNINGDHLSCGRCPSCSERINAFMQVGIKDPIEYLININWG